MSEIRLTNLHCLRSERKHDYAHALRGDKTTHLQIGFAEYKEVNGRLEWTKRSWDAIIEINFLWNLLEIHGLMKGT